jgi:AcrR family transcriptional regulator
MGRACLNDQVLHDVRSRIVDHALTLAEGQGPGAIAIRAIAPLVGLSSMALYRYFPGGQAEILAAARAAGFETLAGSFEAAAGDSLERIVRMCGCVVELATSRPQLYKLMFDISQPEFEVEGTPLGSMRRRAWATPTSAFREAIDRRLLRGDAEVLPHLVFAGLHGVIHFELSGQPYPARQIRTLVPPMLRALLTAHGLAPARLRKIEPLLGRAAAARRHGRRA